MAQYGSRELKKGDQGDDVEELQIRLAGFSGGIPDGDFGPGSEKMVRQFQTDFMSIDPTGIVDEDTFNAIDDFADKYPIDFDNPDMKCPCGVCSGYGQGLRKNEYRQGKPLIEAYYNYEYPGIHRVILWAARAVFFYFPDYSFTFNSGYRCSVRNEQKGRQSTNHHGKAIDLDVPRTDSENREDDVKRCDEIREKIVEKCNGQIGWAIKNKKALEPANIAPTWVHYDVRCFAKDFLEDRFFVKTLEDLDKRVPITLGQEEVKSEDNEETKPLEEVKETSDETEKKEETQTGGIISLVITIINAILSLFSKKK